jgi:superfamily II DNA/RNA helicase
MEQFKKNETTVMLATPNSVRGLDFPALTHVYTLYLPIDDPREYVHLAGRVGRVGQVGRVLGDGAHVVSILKKEDAGKMEELAQKLGFEFEDIDVESAVDDMRRDDDGELDTESLDIDKMRRYLEDTLTLLGTTEEPVVDTDAIDARANAMEDGPLDDEDVDDDVEASYQ